ncbi:hypothetical protein RclHR1_01250006 [Rhizophagus clarus]|uniref:Protein kinase domain-containing protein n=1 Tax=Rhizophagus clarus TaxID=94130 RepID=A0A2Z6Q7E1_9GLOM|nr:hypothetical protein RclHR1_01250006 [Rhizophagus clarus]
MIYKIFGKSENAVLDRFISEKKLKWIPYDQFKNVEFLDKGGFVTIYKAIWLKSNNEEKEVALKCLNNLNDKLDEFLNEWNCHEKCLSSIRIVDLHGFTKNPDTLNYMVIMDYANKAKLIHCDFHDGNILNHKENDEEAIETDEVYISDLGLCQPIKSSLKKGDIYGVIPFIAPEVLRGKPYTPASDVYSFSMIMVEITSGVPLFSNRAHDLQLDLMKKCWNEDPLKRPSASEVKYIIDKWISRSFDGTNIRNDIIEFINAPVESEDLQTYYTSHFTGKSEDSRAYSTSHFTSGESDKIVESECLECIILKQERIN